MHPTGVLGETSVSNMCAPNFQLPVPEVECPPDYALDEGRLEAFIHAAEKYRAQLVWIASQITNRREDAEDAVQQALLKAFANLAKFRGESQMKTWLSVIVQNTAREQMRSKRGKVCISLESTPYIDGSSDDIDVPDTSMNPEESLACLERERILFKAVGQLGGAHRRIMQMCVFEQVPYGRVATRLNIKLSTVKSRVFRGKMLLKEAISSRARYSR